MTRRGEIQAFVGRLRVLGVAIVAILVFGTAGLALTEHVSVWRGFEWALDTVTTNGSIGPPHSAGGQAVKTILLVLGVGTLFYALVTVTEMFVSGDLADLLAERRTRRAIEATSDHYVICGFGRVGRQVARDLHAAGARYVVIDHNPASRDHIPDVGVRFIEGEPSDEAILRAAGIERARGVIACVDSDAENIFVTLTVRELRPEIPIVARASAEESETKLLRAGATRVISPYKSSGTEMARLALNPQIVGTMTVTPEYRMEEIRVSAGCRGSGQKIGDVRGGAIIVGVRNAEGQFLPQPEAETVLNEGDVILAMGTVRTMDRLEALLDPARRAPGGEAAGAAR